MRGRKPRSLALKPEDVAALEALLRDGKTELRTARRARILLGVHRGERIKTLSEHVDQDPATLWRVCRRYEERGMGAVYDAPRSGRPPGFSPSRSGAG